MPALCCCRYHSHPIFAPKPSQKDSENQRNYQALFRCEETRLEPFIGAIVGPYDLQLPTQVPTFPVQYTCMYSNLCQHCNTTVMALAATLELCHDLHMQ